MATPAAVPQVLPPTELPVVGFCETYLDPVIERSLNALDSGTSLITELLPPLRNLWDQLKEEVQQIERDLDGKLTKRGGYQARRDLMAVVKLVEKLSKAMAYSSRITDELARLRAFAKGAPDSRRELDVCIDVTGKGETELLELMLKAAAQSGRLCPGCTAKALNGG